MGFFFLKEIMVEVGVSKNIQLKCRCVVRTTTQNGAFNCDFKFEKQTLVEEINQKYNLAKTTKTAKMW